MYEFYNIFKTSDYAGESTFNMLCTQFVMKGLNFPTWFLKESNTYVVKLVTFSLSKLKFPSVFCSQRVISVNDTALQEYRDLSRWSQSSHEVLLQFL